MRSWSSLSSISRSRLGAVDAIERFWRVLGDPQVHLRDPVRELQDLAGRHGTAGLEEVARFLHAAERGEEVDLGVVRELVLDETRRELRARPANAVQRRLTLALEGVGDRDAELGEGTHARRCPPRTRNALGELASALRIATGQRDARLVDVLDRAHGPEEPATKGQVERYEDGE
jgi:hypothetical protein